mgnify:CR=1 FL=1
MSASHHALSHHVSPLLLTQEQLEPYLKKLDVAACLHDLFSSLAQGKAVQPAQSLTLLPEDKGDFITYQGGISGADVFGAKLSPYLVTGDKPIISAWTTLMSSRTGQPLLCCDSSLLTLERTAGTTALAVDQLAPIKANRLAIIGSGPVALAHLKHVLNLRDWQSISIYSPNLNEDGALQDILMTLDKRIEICVSSQACVQEADVIMLCTSSGTPVIDEKDLTKQDVLITSISTNVANAHEICPSTLGQMDVYCDYKATTPLSAGEMKLAVANHAWSVANVKGDLADLVNQDVAKPTYERPVFFRSIGLGLEDIAMAYGIWAEYQVANA